MARNSFIGGERLRFITNAAGTKTVPATFADITTYTQAQLLTDLAADTTRTAQLRRVNVMFHPQSDFASGNDAPIEVQLGWSSIAGQVTYMTNTVALSSDNPRQLSFTLPQNFVEYRPVNSGTALLSVTTYNRTSTTAPNVYYRISTEWDLAPDVAQSV